MREVKFNIKEEIFQSSGTQKLTEFEISQKQTQKCQKSH